MKSFNLLDGGFPNSQALNLAGENLGQSPLHFRWIREPGKTTFFTDICLPMALTDSSPHKIAWLIEPPEISNMHYEFVKEHEDLFDYILTWRKDLIDGEKYLFYPFGGSWVQDWEIPYKSKLVSVIASDKTKTSGHQLRHDVVKHFGSRLDIYGHGYNPIDSIREALADYAYSVVIENSKIDWWFTEKLIDCFSMGTIPIYWGCDVERFGFNPDGIIKFNNLGELDTILHNISFGDYRLRRYAIEHNLQVARKFRCAEDWIYEAYLFLFN